MIAAEGFNAERQCGECEGLASDALGPSILQIYSAWAHHDCAEGREAMREAGWWLGCLASWRRTPGGTAVLREVLSPRHGHVLRALLTIPVVN